MILAEARVGDLAALARDLQNTATALVAQMRKSSANKRNRSEQIRINNIAHLRVVRLFRRAQHAIAGIADDGINAAELAEGAVKLDAHRAHILEIKRSDVKLFGIALAQAIEGLRPSAGSDDTIPTLQNLFRQHPA
jgi:hypothetical protein